MNLYKAILLLLIFITPLRADTIYNLIKIPNLEVYKISAQNKLRYLNAIKPFRLGVNIKKNIRCYNSDKRTLNKKYEIISKNLNRYSSSFLSEINLKYIVLCENLTIADINTAGIPNNLTRTLILDIKFNNKYFERAIHHEVFHIINDSHKELFKKKEWETFNKKKFRYSKCSTCTDNLNLELYNKTDGFLTEYSKSTVSEDMAEVYSHLMFYGSKTFINDPILAKKIQFIKNNVLKIDNTFKF
tara:strand:- start:139 stop:870 length:732 start_codon:yes stop_codon:yes gene_type:complete